MTNCEKALAIKVSIEEILNESLDNPEEANNDIEDLSESEAGDWLEYITEKMVKRPKPIPHV